MARRHPDRPEAGSDASPLTIVTCHGEGETRWHVVDPTAPESQQPAVIRTFSSRDSTREDLRRFLAGLPQACASWYTAGRQTPPVG